MVVSELTLDSYYVDSKLEQQTEADYLKDLCLGARTETLKGEFACNYV